MLSNFGTVISDDLLTALHTMDYIRRDTLIFFSEHRNESAASNACSVAWADSKQMGPRQKLRHQISPSRLQV